MAAARAIDGGGPYTGPEPYRQARSTGVARRPLRTAIWRVHLGLLRPGRERTLSGPSSEPGCTGRTCLSKPKAPPVAMQ